jgi:paraquat-inducible protein B
MSKVNPTLIGAFVLSAIAMLVAAVLVLGSGKMFKHTYTFVLFFKSDVEGLRVGAPVKFKGVEVGTVKEILLALPNAPEPTAQVGAYGQLVIPVLVELDANRITKLGATKVDLNDPQTVPALIRAGLRAQLATESLLTGLLYIALAVRPDTSPQMILSPGTHYQEIPTIPTTMETVQGQAMHVLAKLQTVDVAAALTALVDAAQSIKQRVNSPDVDVAIRATIPALQNIGDAAQSVRLLANDLHTQAGPLAENLRATAKKTDLAVNQAHLAFSSIETSFQPGSPLTYKMNNTLDDVSSAARAVRQLADYLEQNPSALIRGRSDAQASK